VTSEFIGSSAARRPSDRSARVQKRPLSASLFHTLAGYDMTSYQLSKAILTSLESNSGVFEVTATEDTSEFSTENLKRYAA